MKNNLDKFVNSQNFQTAVIIAIVCCSVLLGVETYFPQHNLLFDVLDISFTIFFIIEILLRILAAKGIVNFFYLFTIEKLGKDEEEKVWRRYKFNFSEEGFWNWFDFTIIFFSSISLFGHFTDHPEFLIVSRLARVSRIMRLLEISSDLKLVERKIVSIIPTIFSFALLLGILLYIYAIIGIYLFGHHKFEMADFHDLPSALLTLFQLMTLDGWAEVMASTAIGPYNSWFYKGYFISFVILTAIISFNVFVAVLTSQVDEKLQQEQRKSNEKLDHIEEEVEDVEEELSHSMKLILSELKDLKAEMKELKEGRG